MGDRLGHRFVFEINFRIFRDRGQVKFAAGVHIGFNRRRDKVRLAEVIAINPIAVVAVLVGLAQRIAGIFIRLGFRQEPSVGGIVGLKSVA